MRSLPGRPTEVPRRFALAAATLFVVSLAAPAALAQEAAPEVVVHVAPGGAGTSCSTRQPCSLATGLATARTAMTRPGGDVVVEFGGGDYRISQPVQLGAADSGRDGRHMVWRAAPAAKPVINGGRRVTGWTPWSGRAGVVRARIPQGLDARQFYVNGTPASRTRATAGAAFGRLAKTGDGKGFTATGRTLQDLTRAELVWRSSAGANIGWQGWTERRCPVAQATATTVLPAQPCYGAAGGPNAQQGVGIPTHVESSLELLAEPGQFYVDPAAGWLYYLPRPGEQMAAAVAELPVSQGLLHGDGVHDLTIQGLSFRHDSWLRPSTTEGFADVQATAFTNRWGYQELPPGALSFGNSDRVVLSGIEVSAVGASGVQFVHGSAGNRLQDSTVHHVAGNGVVLGDLDSGQRGDTGNVVSNNRIHHTSYQYPGGVAVFAGYVSGTRITNNTITDVPYTGISLGWGWGTPSVLGDNRVEGNRIERVMQSDLFDGGAVYVNGTSNRAARSTVRNNHLSDTGSHGVHDDICIGVYLDGSASNVDVSSNVVHRTQKWLAVQTVPGQTATANTVTGNWTSAPARNNAAYEAIPVSTSNTISGNLTGLTSWPAAAQRVIDASGHRPATQPVAAPTTPAPTTPAPSPSAPATSRPVAPRTGLGDFTGDRIADLVTIDARGQLLVHPGTRTGIFGASRVVASGWQSTNWLGVVADVTGDQVSDLLARRSDGTLWRHDGTINRGFSRGTRLATGWGSRSLLTVAGDVNGDQRPDLLARDASGRLFRHTVTTTLSAGRQVASGWNGVKFLAATGRSNADGIDDVTAIGSTGVVHTWYGSPAGFTSSRRIATGWVSFNHASSPGDLNLDGRRDLVGRTRAGAVYGYRNKGTGFAPGVRSARNLAGMRVIA